MDEVLLSSVLEALVRVGKPNLLSQKLTDLHRNGKLTVNGAQTFGSLIKAYGHAHDVDGAWRCWKEMRSRHIKPTSVTIGCMVEAVASRGDVDGAYELICQLLEDDQCKELVNAVIFGSVLKGYSRTGRMERVWAVFNEMLSQGIQPSVSTFNVVIDACTRSGRMDAVKKLRGDMEARSIKPNIITFSTMIKGFCQHGDMPKALEVLHELHATPGLEPDGIVYNTVLEGCLQAGLIVEGERLFSEMQVKGVAPNNHTMTVMVRLMTQARRVDRAFELVESMTHKYRFRANSHVWNALIHACLANRDLSRAVTVCEQMFSDRQYPDTRTRQQLVRGLVAAGNPNQAAKVLRAVLAVPVQSGPDQQSNHWCQHDDVLLGETLEALAQCGLESANLGKQLIMEVRKSYPKVRVDSIVEGKVLRAASRVLLEGRV